MRTLQTALLFLIVSTFSSAANYTDPLYTFEIGFRVVNSQGTAAVEAITIYTLNSTSRDFEVAANGSSSSSFLYGGGQYNAVSDVGDNNTSGATLGPVSCGETYYIRIGNKFFIASYQGGACGDFAFQYNTGTQTMSLMSNNSGYSISGPYTWTTKSITLKNDFGGDRASVSGKIYINSLALNNIGYSGTTLTREDRTFPHSISGEDNQYISTYYRKWREWIVGTDPNITKTLSAVQGYDETARYARKCNLTVQNDFAASGSEGNINFQSIQYSSPYQPSEAYEDLTYSAQALSQTINSVYYTFNNWDFNSTNISTQNPITSFRPTSHGTLKAKFNGKVVNTYRSMSFNYTEVGQPVRISWNKHPLDNSEITHYAIWRKVDKETATQIGTLYATGSATYTFTDNMYVISNSINKVLLHYDVRAYYLPSSTYSDFEMAAVYGETYAKMNQSQQTQEVALELPTEHSIGNFPNPFNPTTTIKYQLPEAGMVTLKVYDILGREVAELVNENKAAGYYEVNFDASELTSGVYIYTISADKYTESKKMILAK